MIQFFYIFYFLYFLWKLKFSKQMLLILKSLQGIGGKLVVTRRASEGK